MKKRKLITTSIMAICVLGTSVFAKGSGYVKSPGFIAGDVKSRGGTYNCYSSRSTALTVDSYTYFKDYKTLPLNFKASNSRTLTVQLWDEDPIFNSDDLLKTYKCKFSGRTPSGRWNIKQNNSDSIDGQGDDCAELYIKGSVSKVKKDPKDPYIHEGVFKYNVGVK